MNPERVAALDNFVMLHTHRLPKPSGEALVYLVAHAAQIPLDTTLVAYSRGDIATSGKFNIHDLSVQWLLESQMQLTDHYNANLIGMFFDDGTILAHTVKQGALRNPQDSDDEM